MRYKILVTMMMTALVAGCAADSGNKQMTDKEQAIQTWNVTRGAVMLSLARDQYSTGNFDKCRESLVEAMRMDPTNPATHILSAKVYIEQGQLDPALSELNTARTLDPKLAEADYLSGVIYQRWQQPSKALDFYQTACIKAPTELAYVMAKAETMVALGRQVEALALLQSKVVYFEHSAVIRDAVGMLLMQQNRIEDAVDMFRRATILAPDDLSMREHLASALYQDKKYVEAADILAALVNDPSNIKRGDLRLTLAECQLALGRTADARIMAQSACDLEESSADAWLTLAKITFEMGDLSRTDSVLRRAISLEDNNAEAYLLKGYLRLRQEKYQDALDAFDKAAQIDATDATSLCMAGYTLGKMSRPKEAAEFYNRALKLNPKDDLATRLMAELPTN
jgi:Tfp pilus assembly protein PilF